MAADTVPALVLDDTVSGAASEPCHFGDFPGLWLEGQPVAVSELGFASAKDCYAAVEAAGLPLKKTTVKVGEGAMPEVWNHVPEGGLLEQLAAPDEKPAPKASTAVSEAEADA